MKSARTFFLSFLLASFFLLILLVKPTFAQTQFANDIDADVPQDTHTWVQTVTIEVMSALTCQLAGVDPLRSDQKCLGINPATRKIGYVENTGGALGALSAMTVALYTPPIHTADYFQNVAQNFGLVKHAYAQNTCDEKTRGIGYCGIQPLLQLWTAFRNLVFLLFVLVFILIGIGIMLRIQIDPRTVMTIENSIPKIIIALLLITFSFAIAGLLIDLMYVAIFIVFNFFADPKAMLVPTDKHEAFVQAVNATQASISGENPFAVLNHLFPSSAELIRNGAGGVKDIVANMFLTGANYDPQASGSNSTIWNAFLFSMRAMPATAGIANALNTNWGWNILGGFIGYLAGALAFLVIAVALIVAMFRLWFGLLTAYIYVLLDIILAPFFIVGGVFPGSPISFDMWLRDMIANLSSFVVTIAMFLLGRVFIDVFSNPDLGTVFVPPLIGNPMVGHIMSAGGQTVTISNGGLSPIGGLIGVGIILMTPTVVNMMKELLKAPTFKYSAEVFKNVGSGQKIVGSTAGTGFGAYGALMHGTSPVGGGAEGLRHFFTGKLASMGGGH